MSDACDTRAYGTWPSPISAADVARSGGAMTWVDQSDGALWWVESNPAGGGRLALMRDDALGIRQMTSASANVRNRVHEYGGASWAVVPPAADSADGAARWCYTEWTDQRLYLEADGVPAVPLTPMPQRPAGYRYAEPRVVGDEIWTLREDFYGEAPTDLVRDYVAIPLDGRGSADPGAVRTLGAGDTSGGHHFLSGLRVSPDGTRAAWIGWDHPNMPWDQTELVLADIEDGVFVRTRVVAGTSVLFGADGQRVSICQLEWDGDDAVVYLTDVSGWWNLERYSLATAESAPILTVQEELGGALWKPGLRWFAPLGAGRFGVLRHGEPCILDETSGTLTALPAPTGVDLPLWSAFLSAWNGRLASVGYGPLSQQRLVSSDGQSTQVHGEHESLPRIGGGPSEDGALVHGAPIDPLWLPRPELRFFDGGDGVRVPANVYPPTNPHVQAPAGEKPPYVVHIHGGPTGANGISLDLEIAYFTSRGIGVVAPEYGGSTGFGRAWRTRLDGQWGVVDQMDAATVARGLIASGEADPARLVIRGGSAGGFSSALAMTTPSLFAVGLVKFPVIDLLAWMSGENHDLESEYLTGLVGELPEQEQRYRDRSPADNAPNAHGPMLILQGLDDQICMPQTTLRFVESLIEAGAPHQYVGYEGEQHGFRKTETIAHAIATEFQFLCAALGISPDAAEEPIALKTSSL